MKPQDRVAIASIIAIGAVCLASWLLLAFDEEYPPTSTPEGGGICSPGQSSACACYSIIGDEGLCTGRFDDDSGDWGIECTAFECTAWTNCPNDDQKIETGEYKCVSDGTGAQCKDTNDEAWRRSSC